MVTDSDKPRHRERIIADHVKVNRHGFMVDYPQNVRETVCRFISRQITDDEINPWYQYQQMRRKAQARDSLGWKADKGLHWDVGGNFTSTQYTYEDTGEFYSATLDGSLQRFFEGQIYPKTAVADPNNSSHRLQFWKVPPLSSTSDLDAFGATAISRVAPVNPHSAALQGLVELRREGLPSLPGFQALKNRSLSPKQVSGEYLNYQFGLKPLISEIRATAIAMRNSEELIKQYLRDSGRPVRRRYTPPEEVRFDITLEDANGYPAGGVSSYFLSTPNRPLNASTNVRTKRWFSGTFIYHADDRILGLLGDQLRRAEYLYGLKPDMADLYNLTPWTWLVDWFTNTGDVVNNLKMFTSDGLVMSRGYVMETIRSSCTFYFSPGMVFDATEPVETRQTFGFTRKVRRRANPFGFGLTKEDLSPRQWAILAALGITQSGRWQG